MLESRRTSKIFFPMIATIIIVTGIFIVYLDMQPPSRVEFSGERAYHHIVDQVAFGPRIPGSPGHSAFIEWLTQALNDNGWKTKVEEASIAGQIAKNITAKRGRGDMWVILGAHYDTRIFADEDPDPNLRTQPAPGANDGASGVAVLLELSRALPKDLPVELWLAFFDAEDNGRIAGWDWILGSQAYAETLRGIPDAVVIVDMVGDADLNIYKEKNSDPDITNAIWAQADALGYKQHFIPTEKYSILDDHTPFLQRGIPAIDIIDFDYPYRHTTQDTVDKVSGESLMVVGKTLQYWLMNLSK
jgi:Zn-dependent M28 family amino/carboxypeptidase